MPELPEVETVRRTLEPNVVGRTIIAVRPAGFADVMGPGGLERSDVLAGLTIRSVDRRGKYLRVGLDDGSGLVIHLRMTGQLVLAQPDDPPLRFERLAVALSPASGAMIGQPGGLDPTAPLDIRFADQRKFGRVIHVAPNDPAGGWPSLGPEPLDPAFTPEVLGAALARRTAPVKNVLLDQRRVAGIGNIYADEALFHAAIHPATPAGELGSDAVTRLHRAMVDVLASSLDRRGTTFSSFRDAYGGRGDNLGSLFVYGRGTRHLPCRVCGTPLQSMKLAGRTTTWCPACQPLRPNVTPAASR